MDLTYVRVTVKMDAEESSGSGGRVYSVGEVVSAGFLYLSWVSLLSHSSWK